MYSVSACLVCSETAKSCDKVDTEKITYFLQVLNFIISAYGMHICNLNNLYYIVILTLSILICNIMSIPNHNIYRDPVSREAKRNTPTRKNSSREKKVTFQALRTLSAYSCTCRLYASPKG